MYIYINKIRLPLPPECLTTVFNRVLLSWCECPVRQSIPAIATSLFFTALPPHTHSLLFEIGGVQSLCSSISSHKGKEQPGLLWHFTTRHRGGGDSLDCWVVGPTLGFFSYSVALCGSSNSHLCTITHLKATSCA